jgi:hypothetical protein
MENQESNETVKSGSFLTGIGSYIENIAVPTIIKKNLIRSVSKLIVGAIDVPVAMLEAKVQQIKAESKGMAAITDASAKSVAEKFAVDEDLVNRSVNHFGSKLFKEQLRRESAVQVAMEDLRLNPPKADAGEEIDEDWLEMFSRIAETKSNSDMQLLLGKILAGEIRSPNTFSAKTVHTLSVLNQKTAKLFQLFCNISFEIPEAGNIMTCVIAEPFGSPNDNKLLPLGLSYMDLSLLRDDGLIQHDFDSWRPLPSSLFYYPVKVGNTILNFILPEPSPENITERVIEDLKNNKNHSKVTVINFTQVGIELRKVMPIITNPTYNEKFVAWIEPKFNFKLKTEF